MVRAGRPAVVQVRRDQEGSQQFWLAVLSAIRQARGATGGSEALAATPDFNEAGDGSPLAGIGQLSPAELRVLRYLPTNLSRREIASELSVSVNTVNTHVRNIYAKLQAQDRSSAVQRARQACARHPARRPALKAGFTGDRSGDPDLLDPDWAVLAQRQRAGLGHPAGLDGVLDRAR
jgi:DNA-binding CsgD family transcriptional regulator